MKLGEVSMEHNDPAENTIGKIRKVAHIRDKYRQNTMRPKTNSNNFGGFLELICRFEFELSLRKLFFERFEFLVCSKFNHTQCGRTCACAVAFSHPHNSISNVVASVTIYDDMYIYSYVFLSVYVSVYLYSCMFICVCVCLFVVCCVLLRVVVCCCV